MLLFQVTINKKNILINEIINFLSIDINYIVKKIEDLTNEKNIINEIYCFFVLANMDSIYQNNRDNSLRRLILDNIKNNERMEKLIKNTEFGLLFLGKNGKIYDEEMNLLSEGIIPEKKMN